MLTLIVQRCLESPYELRQQIVESLRTLFKTAGTPSDTHAGEQKVTFPIFLNFAAPYLVRCPQDFMAVVVAAVKFVRITVKPASPDPAAIPEKTTTASAATTTAAVDTDGAVPVPVPVAASEANLVFTPNSTARMELQGRGPRSLFSFHDLQRTGVPPPQGTRVTPPLSHFHDMSNTPGEIHVALHKKDTLERRLLSMERGLASHHIEANGRCAVVLDALIRHFLELNDVTAPEGLRTSPQSGRSTDSGDTAGVDVGDSKEGLGLGVTTTNTTTNITTTNTNCVTTPTPRTTPSRLMFTRADVIETMADCAIDLFAFPAALGT